MESWRLASLRVCIVVLIVFCLLDGLHAKWILRRQRQASGEPPAVVPVLLQLDEETQRQVEAALTSKTMSLREINDAVDAVFAQQPPPIQAQYNATKEAYQRAMTQLEAQHASEIKLALPETQMADALIRQVAKNDSLTNMEINRAIVNIFFAQPPEVQEELNRYAIYRRGGGK